MMDLFDLPSPKPSEAFDGIITYVPDRDYERLSGQLKSVFDLMQDGSWRTLRRIASAVGGSEAGVSARLRDLRKEKYGSMSVQRRYVVNGLHEYRLNVRRVQAA